MYGTCSILFRIICRVYVIVIAFNGLNLSFLHALQATAESVCRRIGLLDAKPDTHLLIDPHAITSLPTASLTCLTAIEFDKLSKQQQAEAVQQMVVFCRQVQEKRSLGSAAPAGFDSEIELLASPRTFIRSHGQSELAALARKSWHLLNVHQSDFNQLETVHLDWIP